MNKLQLVNLLIWIVIVVTIVCVECRDDYTYRAYIMHDQYVGDIMVDGHRYISVLIMDVEPLTNKRGDFDLIYNNKYGWYLACSPDHGAPYHGLVSSGERTQLYFAHEYKTKSDLANGEAIGVRWTNPLIMDPVIDGVGSIKSRWI